MNFLALRERGYVSLSGYGVEVGAGWQPAVLPPGCVVEYCDVFTPGQARGLFPEVPESFCARIPNPQHCLDIDRDGLKSFCDRSLDFSIANQVLEQLANPIGALAEFDRVLKPGGKMVLSVSDKEYTYDRHRPLSDFGTLEIWYRQNKWKRTPEDYMDIARYVHPELLGLCDEDLRHHLNRFHSRREHLNVWTGDAFVEFLERSFELLGASYRTVYEVTADRNRLEYFVVLEKG